MSKAPTTLGEMKPGDYGTLPDGIRIVVTGQLDCATLWRYVCRDVDCNWGNCAALNGGPQSGAKGTPVTDVATRVATAEGKLGDSDPLRGGAR